MAAKRRRAARRGPPAPGLAVAAARLARALACAARWRLDTLFAPRLPWPLRWLFALSPLRLIPARAPRAERLRRALEDLGPVFVKFGQAASTRRDLLPADIADELARLQDRVPPFPAGEAAAVVERALSAPLGELFADFEREPMAAASIAQVHGATLPGGQRVVVKVVRPGAADAARRDMAMLRWIAAALCRLLPDAARLRPLEVVEQFRDVVEAEMDLRVEAANTARLKRNFPGRSPLHVPEVHWDYCSAEVMVSERVDGVPVDRVAELSARGADLRRLAERGVEVCFSQVFRDNFFHADMHPGNVHVSLDDPKDPTYIALDCAVIGTLDEAERHYLARNLLAVFERDYALVASLHVDSGWVPPGTDKRALERAVRTVCEPMFARPLGEVSLAATLAGLFAAARDFDMEVQPSLVLLQKTLLQVEGLGRQLYPQLDLWDTAYPFLRRWMRRRLSPAGAYRRFRREWPALLERAPELPAAALAAMRAVAEPPAPPEPRRAAGGWTLALVAALASALTALAMGHGPAWWAALAASLP